MQAEAVFQCQHDRAGPLRIESGIPAAVPLRGLDDVGDQLAPRAQALGELGTALLGARHEQDHLHVQQRGAAERILPAAIGGAQRFQEVGQVAVLGEQIEIALDRLLDVILEHRDDQFILALEVRIERATGETRRRRDRLDAGAADALFLEHPRGCLEQLLAGVISCWSGSNP